MLLMINYFYRDENGGLSGHVTHHRSTLNLLGTVGSRLKEALIWTLSPKDPVIYVNEPKRTTVYWPLGYFFTAGGELLSQKPHNAELKLLHTQ